MRCNTCNKFVSYNDEPDISIDTESIESTDLTADLTITLTCAECGSELKQATATVEESLLDEHACDLTGEIKDVTGEQFLITDSYGTGCQLNPKRWQADLEFTIHCERCNSSFEHTASTELDSSEFEEV